MTDKTNNNFKLYTGLGFLLAGILITLYGFNRISNVEVASFVEYAIILTGIALIVVGTIQLWNHFRTGRPPKNVHVGTTLKPTNPRYGQNPNIAFAVQCNYTHPGTGTSNPPVVNNEYYITQSVLANNPLNPPLTYGEQIYFTLQPSPNSLNLISYNR